MSNTCRLIFGVVPAAMLLFGGCQPKSAAYPRAVSDGTIVLLRQGTTYGAFFMTNQMVSPELMDYRWFMRRDGKTTFDPADPHVTTGSATGATAVAFGPFKVDWSTAGGGGGYVYYPGNKFFLFGHGFRKPGGPSMAVTFEKDITRIDASMKEWKFRQNP